MTVITITAYHILSLLGCQKDYHAIKPCFLFQYTLLVLLWCSCVSVGMLFSSQTLINSSFLFLLFSLSLFLPCLLLFKLLFFFLSHSFPGCLFSVFALWREATWESDRPHNCADIRLVMALQKDFRLIATFSFLSSDMQPSRKTPPLYFKCTCHDRPRTYTSMYEWGEETIFGQFKCTKTRNEMQSTAHIWLTFDLSGIICCLLRQHSDRKIERCKDAWRHSEPKCKASRKPVRHSGTRVMVGHADRQMDRCTAGKSCPWIVSIPANL